MHARDLVLVAFAVCTACAGTRPVALVGPGAAAGSSEPSGRRVAGRVVGASLAEVEVALVAMPDGFERPRIVARTRTRPDGRFDLSAPGAAAAGGRLLLIAVAPERAPAAAPVDLDGPAAVDDLTVALGACGVRIGGTIVDRAGAPLAGVEVRYELTGVVLATTDTRGRYELCGPVEASELELAAPGFGAVAMAVDAGGSARHDATLDREAVVAGRVVDPAGAGVAGATVWALPDRKARARPAVAVGETDGAGRFEIRGVAAGALVVVAGYLDERSLHPSGIERVTTSPGVARRGIVLHMGASRLVRGIARAGGAPAANVVLTWRCGDELPRQVRTDRAGRFTILLPPGPLELEAPGFEVRMLQVDRVLGPATAEVELARTGPSPASIAATTTAP